MTIHPKAVSEFGRYIVIATDEDEDLHIFSTDSKKRALEMNRRFTEGLDYVEFIDTRG